MCESHLTDDPSWLRKKVLRIFAQNTPDTLKFYMDLGAWARKPLIGPLFHFLCEEYGRYYHGGRTATLEETLHLVDEARSITLVDCACRQTFQKCQKPIQACLAINTGAEVFAREPRKNPRVISREEARTILQECHRQGLLHSVHHCLAPNSYAICNCCSCCCVPLRLRKEFGIENGLLPGKGAAVVDEGKCIACGKCFRLCPAKAVNFRTITVAKGQKENYPRRVAQVLVGECLGCGLCLEVCPAKAISWQDRPSSVPRFRQWPAWQQKIRYFLLFFLAFPLVWAYKIFRRQVPS